MIALDYELHPVNYAILAVGGLESVHIDTRVIYKTFYMSGGTRFSLVHNHPYASSDPSDADLELTLNIVKQCKILNIEFWDHVIIGSINDLDYFSIRFMYPEIWTRRKIVHEYGKDGRRLR